MEFLKRSEEFCSVEFLKLKTGLIKFNPYIINNWDLSINNNKKPALHI